MACSFFLVVSLAAFDVYLGAEIPKLSYSTFLDQYVNVCFCFALVAVFEYATVNFFITQSDKHLVEAGKKMDAFFLRTALIMWIIIVLLFLWHSTLSLTVMIILWMVWLAYGFRELFLIFHRRTKEVIIIDQSKKKKIDYRLCAYMLLSVILALDHDTRSLCYYSARPRLYRNAGNFNGFVR